MNICARPGVAPGMPHGTGFVLYCSPRRGNLPLFLISDAKVLNFQYPTKYIYNY